MATGGGAKLPPYSNIEKDQDEFIEPEYLPKGMVLRQARTMKEADIAQLFEYISHRQEAHGAENAFRFKSFKHKTKGVLRARYPDTVPEADGPDAASDDRQQAPAKRLRRRAGSRKANRAGATEEEAGDEQGEQGDETDAAHDDQDNNVTANRVRHRTRRSKATRIVTTDEEGGEQQNDLGNNLDAANDDQQHTPTARRVPHQTRSRTVAGALSSNQAAGYVIVSEEVASQMKSAGFQIPLPLSGPQAEAQYQIPLTDHQLFIQQRLASRCESVSQPLGIDPLLLPTPSPTPSPMQPTVSTRPRPRPRQRVNPNPSRIQPSRQGKVN